MISTSVGYGESAAEFEALAQSGERISGRRFAKLSERTRQVVWGKFIGYEDPSSQNPWIVIVSDDSTWFEVQSTDEAALSRLEIGFRDVRSVPEANSSRHSCVRWEPNVRS